MTTPAIPTPDQIKQRQAIVEVRDTTLAYGETVIQQALNFSIRHGDIFIIMGGSGCGKSTLMRALTGLLEPTTGQVLIKNVDLWHANVSDRMALMRRQGVMYQSGALWSAMTLRENVSLPLEIHTDLSPAQIRAIADYKLALVGLAGFGDHYPAAISGGMRKRVGVARAMALDPQILFFDEPSAGLDPLNARRLDELISQLRDSLGTTMVVITHELASIFAIGDDAVFLDTERRTMLTTGNPRWLRDHSELAEVRQFLNRGELNRGDSF
ncbi:MULTISPECIES: ABC transporter ATP-binding protein [Thiorhodovibrio]|uniref:ABC transporter ATP-binding protein n=1 Tax=Thiorhodovibrio TaxID=61593 RepID=UPI001911DE28|nr:MULTISPECIES: ATP-binding cassette domain-containing protein [Thiorhodovibrio]MBK5967683.1 polyamine ABC transporter ATP-binding protein [Thiorhodovibrio winogradskyi]WPL11631.1 Glycine betaine/carnitine transport ATP-binding protein GbuA [Thiorhodovibrio litoralis]